MSYNVYSLLLTDGPNSVRFALFIETNNDKRGVLHQLTGNLATGMSRKFMADVNHEDVPGYKGRKYLGTIEWGHHVVQAGEIIRNILPPRKEYDSQMNPLFPGEVIRGPLHWFDEVVEALADGGLLRRDFYHIDLDATPVTTT